MSCLQKMLDTDHGRDSFVARKETREEALECDKYAIGIFKEQEEEFVGHIPIKVSQLIYHFLNEFNEHFVEASVSGKGMRKIRLVVLAQYATLLMRRSQKFKERRIFFILN